LRAREKLRCLSLAALSGKIRSAFRFSALAFALDVDLKVFGFPAGCVSRQAGGRGRSVLRRQGRRFRFDSKTKLLQAKKI
jgi:hypothetical protein